MNIRIKKLFYIFTYIREETFIIHQYTHRYLPKIDTILFYLYNKLIRIRLYKNKNN
jgi:hypothetical protein